MGRYPLLLETVMKKSAENNLDRELIPQALSDFRSILNNINIEAGKSKNIVLLRNLSQTISGTEEETKILQLQKDGRQVVRDGSLVFRKNTDMEVNVFLFDHIFLVTRRKDNNYKIIKKVTWY
jgi:hypothetical protein